MNSSRPGRDARARGFTLLEIIIAIFVFAVVIGAMHVVFFSAFRLRAKTSDAIERGLPLQQTLAILKRDLANIVPPGGALSGSLQSTPTATTSASATGMNRQNGPQFYTAVNIVNDDLPWSEIERVSYGLATSQDKSPGMELHRYVTHNLLPANQEDSDDQYLMSGVDSLTFRYYDGSSWRDTWDSTQADTVTGLTNNLPRAIKVELLLHNEDRTFGTPAPVELIVPIMVLGRTNNTTEVTGGSQ